MEIYNVVKEQVTPFMPVFKMAPNFHWMMPILPSIDTIMIEKYGNFAYIIALIEEDPLTFLTVIFILLIIFILTTLEFTTFDNKTHPSKGLNTEKFEAENEISVLRGHLDIHSQMMAYNSRLQEDLHEALRVFKKELSDLQLAFPQTPSTKPQISSEIYESPLPTRKLLTIKPIEWERYTRLGFKGSDDIITWHPDGDIWQMKKNGSHGTYQGQLLNDGRINLMQMSRR